MEKKKKKKKHIPQLFRLVSLWCRKVTLTATSVEDLSTLLWAATTLKVDHRLQEHISEILNNTSE